MLTFLCLNILMIYFLYCKQSKTIIFAGRCAKDNDLLNFNSENYQSFECWILKTFVQLKKKQI